MPWNNAIHSEDWKSMKLLAFDSPLLYGETYEARLQFLKESIVPYNGSVLSAYKRIHPFR